MTQHVRSAAEVEYPSGDGQPMAENDWQLHAIIDSISALQLHYRGRPDVYVSGDLFIYYEEGNPRARVAPDVFVAFGVPKRKRPIYKLWEEGVVPAFVMEVASVSTWREDDGRKLKLYERLGVREYWQYDPTGEYLGLHLKAHRLVEGGYVPQSVVESIDGTLLLRSESLGLDFRVKGEEFHFFDPTTGERLRSLVEEYAARRAAESEAREAEAQTRAAKSWATEAEAQTRAAKSRATEAESRAKAAKSWATEAESRAEAAKSRATEAESRATEAESRAEAAEAELAALRALLDERGG